MGSAKSTLKDDSYIVPLINNLVTLLNDGTWQDSNGQKTQILSKGLIPILCDTITLPALSFFNGSTVDGSKLDPLEFGTAFNVSGGSCTADSTQVKWCYPRCPADYTGVGPVCWQTCPGGYTDTGIRCEDMYGNGVGYPKLDHYDRGGGRLAHTGLHGFFQCDCGANETTMSPCWCAPVCTADEDASIGNGDRFNICYPKCRPGYTGNLTMCDKWACNPGDFDNGAGLCYPACRPGYTTDTGIVCSRSFTKSTTTRGVGRVTSGDCNADEDSTTVLPEEFLTTCYGGMGWARLVSVAGLAGLKILKSQVQYDGCDKTSRSMVLRLTASAVITVNAEYGFKVCLGFPIGKDCPWPVNTYQRSFTSPVTLDIVLTIPFDTDWFTTVTMHLGQSDIKFENITGMDFTDFIRLARECMGIASAAAVSVASAIPAIGVAAGPIVASLIAALWITMEVELKKLDVNVVYQLINEKALTQIPSDLIAKYCPIKDVPLLLAGDPCK